MLLLLLLLLLFDNLIHNLGSKSYVTLVGTNSNKGNVVVPREPCPKVSIFKLLALFISWKFHWAFIEIHQTLSIKFGYALSRPTIVQMRSPQCLYPMLWDNTKKQQQNGKGLLFTTPRPVGGVRGNCAYKRTNYSFNAKLLTPLSLCMIHPKWPGLY